MKKNRAIEILILLFFIELSFLSCNKNNSLSNQEKVNNENSTPIGTEQEINPNNKLPNAINTPSAITPAAITPTKKATTKNKVIATFSTKLLDRHKNRLNNIKRASTKLNNYILKPGQIFSFNGIVGKRVAEKGYKNAKILVDGEQEEAIGGGICQLSSTIYNAAKKLNLKIIERHTHSGEIHYLPIGQDASVNYKNKDLKFVNNKSYSIKLKIKIRKGLLTVSIIQL